jgi:D-alanyl-D-alanine carboxypeptidase (penicillin-binding protein 5/6)
VTDSMPTAIVRRALTACRRPRAAGWPTRPPGVPAAAVAAGILAAITLPAAVALPAASPAIALPAAPPATPRQDVGGPDLASTGIVVNYLSRRSRRLPRVPASAYVIADAGTGQVLAAKDPHGLFPPASTLKVLTAITLIPLLNPNAMVVASRQAADTQPTDAGLLAGHAYRVFDLFHALLMISANDAAVALAQATGSLAHGVALINAEARRLQAYDVVAKTPNGLPAPGQVVSAYDEALIARQALRMPAFMRYDSDLAMRFKVKRKKWETLVNQNTLLTQYRGGIGGKIGWTIAARATYIGLARRHGVTLIVTVLHCTPLKEITTGERLLNWGFAMDGKVRPVGTLVPPLTAAQARPAAAHSPAQGAGRAGVADRHGAGSRRSRGRAVTQPARASSPAPAHLPLVIVLAASAAAGLGLGGTAIARRHRRSVGNSPPP